MSKKSPYHNYGISRHTTWTGREEVSINAVHNGLLGGRLEFDVNDKGKREIRMWIYGPQGGYVSALFFHPDAFPFLLEGFLKAGELIAEELEEYKS